MTGLRPTLYDLVYAVVRRIPPGKVSTYGQVSRLVGGCTPRTVGYALSALGSDSSVPWQRVVGSGGRISPRSARNAEGARIQRALLVSEGVEFDSAGKVDMERHGWIP